MSAPSVPTPAPQGASAPGIHRMARRDPARTAVVEPDGSILSFATLSDRVNRWSHLLVEFGATRDEVVAVLLPNSGIYLAVELAAAQLPIHVTPLSGRLTVDEIGYILGDCGAAVFVSTREREHDAVAAARSAGLPISQVVIADAFDSVSGAVAALPVLTRLPTTVPDIAEDGRRMLYTSGTTGRPKGVRRPLTGNSLDTALSIFDRRAQEYGVDHWPGVHLATGPFYHSSPGAHALHALQMGHTVIILGKFDAEAALDAIQRHQVTTTYMVPTMFARLLALDEAVRDRYDVSSLRRIVHSSAPVAVHVKRSMIKWFGPILFEVYGGTEGTATFVDSHEWLAHPGTVGRPRPGADVRILDATGRRLPPNVPGSVFISNPALSFEYFGDAQKTRAQSIDGYFTVGDIGYLDDDGYLFLCDRVADVIVSGGVNIYPAEVEDVLIQHPSVAEAAVIGVPDDEWGETVLAVVVWKDGAPAHADPTAALYEFCRQRLASFKCPRRVEVRAELPRSEIGKVLRRELRDEFWAATGRRL